MKKEEYLEIWDWNTGEPTGQSVERKFSHRSGIPHEGVQLWIYRALNGFIELLFQKRSASKDLYPSVLDISVSGHVPFGLTAGKIEKEAEEELGIIINEKDLEYLGVFRYEETVPENDLFHREFQKIWVMKNDFPADIYTFNDGEVEAVCFVSMDDFRKLLNGGTGTIDSEYYDGRMYRKLLSIENFHPLFFSGQMKSYLDTVFGGIEALELG